MWQWLKERFLAFPMWLRFDIRVRGGVGKEEMKMKMEWPEGAALRP